MVVIAGLIPVSLLVALAREALTPQLPLLAVVCVTAVCNVAALTWIVMPLLTAWLRPWLTR
jgi:antibiotic biosynthesis monooxygenase (ABM) superfamily enzyme